MQCKRLGCAQDAADFSIYCSTHQTVIGDVLKTSVWRDEERVGEPSEDDAPTGGKPTGSIGGD